MQLSIPDMIVHSGPMGRFVLLTLLFFSLVSWSVIFMKFRLFRRVKRERKKFLKMFWSSGSLKAAYSSARDFPYGPEASVFIAGFYELRKFPRFRNQGVKGSAAQPLDMLMAAMDYLKRAVR